MRTLSLLFCFIMLSTGSRPLAQICTTVCDQTHFRIDRGEVLVDFSMYTSEKRVRCQHKYHIVPVLLSADSSQEKELPPLVLSGRTRYLKDLRENRPAEEPYQLLVGKETQYTTVYYSLREPYQPWMDEAALHIREKKTGCASCDLASHDTVILPQILYRPHIRLSSLTDCPVEYVSRHSQCDAFLIYETGKSVLKPTVAANRNELRKIDSVLLFVKGNPDYEIQSIEISGYASPEGGYAYNTDLAERRAATLKHHVVRTHHLADTLLSVQAGAENWHDLVAVLEKTDLPYKEEILQIIREEEDPDLREWKIRQIDEGQPYAVLREVVYPSLRKNNFHISYISRERSPEEARKLVFSKPEELNVHEFYRVADTFYREDTATYAQVLMIAADTYPGHSIANNNAARAALLLGDIEKARNYLLNTRNEVFTFGNRAYLAWKEGRISDALTLWEKAAENGDTTAAGNIKEINKRGY